MAGDAEVTQLLQRAALGDVAARDQLLSELYGRLKALARRQMAAERAGHTLSATALVHEAFLKLVDQQGAYNDRAHFLAVASLAMRRVLVSHARTRTAQKRGSGNAAITLDDQIKGDGVAIDDLVALDDALSRLAQLSERQAMVVVYRAFGAMSDAEIAEVLGVAVPTVRRDYRLATAWLRRELAD